MIIAPLENVTALSNGFFLYVGTIKEKQPYEWKFLNATMYNHFIQINKITKIQKYLKWRCYILVKCNIFNGYWFVPKINICWEVKPNNKN
ncbi:hypothetical protein bcgnr5378_07160 [Bacillus cereus]